jgi:hypothetical protein
MSAKVHTGIVVDDRGQGVQAGLSLGLGIAGKRSAVLESVGFAGGQRPNAGLTVGVDYVRLPERDDGGVGWRAGFGGVVLAYGEPTNAILRAGALVPIRDRYRSGGHEKMYSTSTRTVAALGVEGFAGLMVHDDDHATFGGGGAITFELYSLSRMW